MCREGLFIFFFYCFLSKGDRSSLQLSSLLLVIFPLFYHLNHYLYVLKFFCAFRQLLTFSLCNSLKYCCLAWQSRSGPKHLNTANQPTIHTFEQQGEKVVEGGGSLLRKIATNKEIFSKDLTNIGARHQSLSFKAHIKVKCFTMDGSNTINVLFQLPAVALAYPSRHLGVC